MNVYKYHNADACQLRYSFQVSKKFSNHMSEVSHTKYQEMDIKHQTRTDYGRLLWKDWSLVTGEGTILEGEKASSASP